MASVDKNLIGFKPGNRKTANAKAQKMDGPFSQASSLDHFTTDRGLPEVSGNKPNHYAKKQAAHIPFSSTAQPGTKGSSKRSSY